MSRFPRFFVGALFGCVLTPRLTLAQTPFSDAEKSIEKRIGTLRSVPDADRGQVTRQIAMDIRALPTSQGKVLLANGLANLSTEGDFGHNTLQAVADTLAESLGSTKGAGKDNEMAAYAYQELAQLQKYEHVRVTLRDPEFLAAQKKVAEIDNVRSKADFTLTDLTGKSWTLSALKGKVVLVNFWATWCPPCRKEMPDLGDLYKQFLNRGFVVLAISDEKSDVVSSYVQSHHIPYPVLLDPGRKVNGLMAVDGIPKSFIFDRSGKLVAQAMDMRTRGQFLNLLASAGLQ